MLTKARFPRSRLFLTAAQHINFIFPQKRDSGTAKALSREMPENVGKFRVSYFSGLQTYPNLHPPPRVGPPLRSLPRGGANLCRFVPVRSLQTRASGREFVHGCFGLLGPLVQAGANSDGFGALLLSKNRGMPKKKADPGNSGKFILPRIRRCS